MTRTYLLLFVVMAFAGLNLSALVVLVNNVQPITLTAFRIFIAGISVLIMSNRMGIFKLPNKLEWKTIINITLFNVVLHHSLLTIGLTKTSGVNAGIIQGAGPLITMILSIIILKDIITKFRLLGFLLGFIGVVTVSISNANNLSSVSIGDLCIFLSIWSQSYSFILISKLNPDFDPRLLTGYMLVTGSLFVFIMGLVLERNFSQLTALFSWDLGAIFLFSAIIATAFGHMIFNGAIKKIGPTETTIFLNLSTLFAVLGAAIFLREPVFISHYIGLILIIFGVFIGLGTIEYMIRKNKRGLK